MAQTRILTGREPIYLGRCGSMVSDFVVYHRDLGPECSVWMVPGTHVDKPQQPYRSRILAEDRAVVLAAARAAGKAGVTSTPRLRTAHISSRPNRYLPSGAKRYGGFR